MNEMFRNCFILTNLGLLLRFAAVVMISRTGMLPLKHLNIDSDITNIDPIKYLLNNSEVFVHKKYFKET